METRNELDWPQLVQEARAEGGEVRIGTKAELDLTRPEDWDALTDELQAAVPDVGWLQAHLANPDSVYLCLLP